MSPCVGAIGGIVRRWQGFTRRHPVAVVAALTILFTVCALGAHALESVVYDRIMPGAVVGAITAVYLAVTFVVGLTTPLRMASVAPVVGYAAARLLWPLTPWESYDALTYDVGWAGAVIHTLVPCGIIWFVAYAGRVLGGPTEEGR